MSDDKIRQDQDDLEFDELDSSEDGDVLEAAFDEDDDEEFEDED